MMIGVAAQGCGYGWIVLGLLRRRLVTASQEVAMMMRSETRSDDNKSLCRKPLGANISLYVV